MINRLKYIIIISILLASSVVGLNAEVKIVPYYSMNVTEGVVLPNKGDMMFGLNLTNDVGLLLSPSKESNHRILGFYELKYQGPGMHKVEGEKFSDRWMDHIGLLRYNYYIDKYTSIKIQANHTTEYKRTGTNEVWGKGLYDYDSNGFQFGVGRIFFEKLDTELSVGYSKLDFPNYTDLLYEAQASSGSTSESSAGKQNHALTQYNLNLKYGQSRVFFAYSLMAYEKQKVITQTTQPDGTLYSSTLQKDAVLTLGADHTHKIHNFLLITPSISWKLKGSNQNFWEFKSSGTSSLATIPERYIANYYAYTEYYFGIPCSLLLSKKWDLFYNLEYDWKDYLERPPRDSDGSYLTGKQHNYLFTMSTGFTFKPNAVTRTTLFYTYQKQTSNMKYEQYLPYNYEGNFIGINFNYTY
ncbi:MAG: hypothetical protein LHV68_08295 [Elusimicrobia bacterium]|nr:hypothetical protein [Candidatus Liberimonas magnetica]